jgi:O-antigen/teichoic acid export membrane protein
VSEGGPQDLVDAPQSFDPVELSTEADEAVAARGGKVSAEEPSPGIEAGREEVEEPSATSLLEKALRAAGSDAARYIPVRFVPALTSLITTPLFTRAINTSDYGAFYLLSALASLFSAIAVGWLQSSAVRFYWPSKKDGRINAYTSTVVWTGVTSLLTISAIAGVAVWFTRGSIEDVVLRLVPAAIVYMIFSFYETLLLQVLRAANRASAYAIWSITATILVTAVSVVLVWYGGWGSMGILVGAAVGNLAVVPFILRIIREEGSLSPRRVDTPFLKELLAYGMPLVPAGLAGWALIVLDRFVIGHFRGTAEVGLYSVAYSLGDKIMQLATVPLMLTMMPSLIEVYERQGQALAEKVQSHFTRYFLLLTLPMISGIVASSETFMAVFTGPAYRQAFAVLPLVAAGSSLGQLANIAGAGLGMHKRTQLIMINTVIAAIANVALNIAFVPRYGFFAAAVNTVVAYALLLVLTSHQSRRYMRWIIQWAAIARIGAAAVMMGLAVWALSRTMSPGVIALVVEVAVGVALYPALLVLFKGVRPEERAFVGEVWRRGIARLKKG